MRASEAGWYRMRHLLSQPGRWRGFRLRLARAASLPCRAFVDLAEPRRTGAQEGPQLCPRWSQALPQAQLLLAGQKDICASLAQVLRKVPAARHHPSASEGLAGGSPVCWELMALASPASSLPVPLASPLDAISSSGPFLPRPPARLPRHSPPAGVRGTPSFLLPPTLPLSQDPVPRLFTPRGLVRLPEETVRSWALAQREVDVPQPCCARSG